MGWATPYIAKLRSGQTVQFRPKGNSMSGRIENLQLVTVEPVRAEDLRHEDQQIVRVGDVVLCKVRGMEYLHLVKAIQDGRFLIGNNRGRTNGWIGPNGIFGRVVSVED
jgi:hypothetical protein